MRIASILHLAENVHNLAQWPGRIAAETMANAITIGRYFIPHAKAAFHRAAEIAHDAGRKVALSLSDRFCVERYRSEFRNLAELHIDYLFANENEIEALRWHFIRFTWAQVSGHAIGYLIPLADALGLEPCRWRTKRGANRFNVGALAAGSRKR